MAMSELPFTLDELRTRLQEAQQEFDNSKTWTTANQLAKAQKEFDTAIEEARSSFFVIEGSNGLHTKSPSDIMAQALTEIKARAMEMEERFGWYFNQDGYKAFKYLYQVADQALKDSGK